MSLLHFDIQNLIFGLSSNFKIHGLISNVQILHDYIQNLIFGLSLSIKMLTVQF